MRLVLVGLVLLVGCKKSGAPASGVELVYSGATLTAATAATVDKRLAALKLHGTARLEDGKLKVRVNSPELDRVKGNLLTAGSLEFFGVDDNTSKKLCAAPHPDEVTLEKETLVDGSVTCFFSGPKPAVKAAAEPVLGPQLRLQKLVDGKVRTFAVFVPAFLTGTSVVEATAVALNDSSPNPAVSVRFDEEGKALFAKHTELLIDMRVAIVLDGMVLTAPIVHDKITGGSAIITMGQKDESASLAAALSAGQLPQLALESESPY